jgi:hypothetical protein
LAASMPALAPRYTIQRSPEQRSPDRQASFLRRRTLAGTGPLPPHLMAKFTTGEQAALKIVANEWIWRRFVGAWRPRGYAVCSVVPMPD